MIAVLALRSGMQLIVDHSREEVEALLAESSATHVTLDSYTPDRPEEDGPLSASVRREAVDVVADYDPAPTPTQQVPVAVERPPLVVPG